MKTAIEIINRAASKIGVKRSGVPLTPDEITDFISEMNNMMTEADAGGTKLGYTIVSSQADEITTPDWTFGAMESNLAVRSAPDYDAQVSQALALQANESWKIVLHRTVELGTVNFPDILPIGGGNRRNGGTTNRFFTNEYADDLITGSGETLADTEDLNIQED